MKIVQQMSGLDGAIGSLVELQEDSTVPRNVRINIQNIINHLKAEIELPIKLNKSLNDLGEIANDVNLQSYTRTQIWNIMSVLEKYIKFMKYAHQIKLSVFSYEHEDKNSVLDAFLGFFPFNLEENRVILKKTNASGFSDKKIEIFEAVLAKDKLINQFLNNIQNNLSEVQKGQLVQQAESRLDNELSFFIRFDKDSWIKGRKLFLTDSGNCFHLKMSVAASPRKREVALKMINELFSK